MDPLLRAVVERWAQKPVGRVVMSLCSACVASLITWVAFGFVLDQLEEEQSLLFALVVFAMPFTTVFVAAATALATHHRLVTRYGPWGPHERQTRCRKCGYILRGITEPRCPECGETI